MFRELNRGKCKTYLWACEKAKRAALVDPLRERIDRYLALLAYEGLRLQVVIDTHTHADHRSACLDLRDLTGAEVAMHRRAPAPHVDRHVDDGDVLEVGDLRIKVLSTPGHTPDGICLYGEGRVLTGDTLLIRGTGRSDFAGGDAGTQYDAITDKLFTLPAVTTVFPAHDYRGNTSSTIGEEQRLNPRLAGRSREEYVDLMANLGLPLPTKIQEVLQPNQSALEDDRVKFPSLAELNQVRQLDPQQVDALRTTDSPPLILDVREPHEYDGELGHIPGSALIPLATLPGRTDELGEWKDRLVIAVCRSGVRSTTAAAILTALGFERACNLKGGMLDWSDAGLPTERTA